MSRVCLNDSFVLLADVLDTLREDDPMQLLRNELFVEFVVVVSGNS